MRSAVLVLLTATTASASAAEGLAVRHEPVACARADAFPRLDARLEPADQVALARVKFRTGDDWFVAEMRREGDRWVAVLPQPKKSLDSFRYFVDVVGIDAGDAKSPEVQVAVIHEGDPCPAKGRVAETVVPATDLLIDRPPGASTSSPLVPKGFKPELVAGNIGMFDLTTPLALGGAALAGGGALLALRKESDKIPPPPDEPFIAFDSSDPAPGSTISISSGQVLTMQFRVNTRSEPVPAGPFRVSLSQFRAACYELVGTFPGAAPNQSVPVTVATRIERSIDCVAPFSTSTVLATAEDGTGRASVYTVVSFPTYNFVP